MEFLAGIAALGIGLALVGAALRFGGRFVTGTFRAAIIIELVLVALLWLDWGYSWVEVTAIDMALNKNLWIALPQAMAAVAVLSVLCWGRAAAPAAALVAAIQAASSPIVLHLVGMDQDMSFLAGAPLLSVYLSVVAAFLFLPAACSVLPAPGGKWHLVAFGPRSALIEAISSLAGMGLEVAGPRSVFESGSAMGRATGAMVRVSTEPSVLPPRYALRIEVERPAAPGALPALPGFARRESMKADGRTVRYIGTSDAGFDVTPERLRRFIETAAGVDERPVSPVP